MNQPSSRHEVSGHAFSVARDPAQAGAVLTTDGQDPKIPLGPYRDLRGDVWHVGARLTPFPRLQAAMRGFSPPDDPYAQVLRDAAFTAYCQALKAQPQPAPTFAQKQQAATLGIELPDAPPLLTTWVPNTACHYLQQNHPGSPEALRDHAVLCPAYEFPPPLAMTLARAVTLSSPRWRLYEPNPGASGYAWYDRLDTVVRLEPNVDRMALRVHLQGQGGTPVGPALLATHILMPAGTYRALRPDALPEVRCTPLGGLAPDDAANLMAAAYFDYTPEEAADWETQHARFGDRALYLAASQLEGEDAARRRVLGRILAREAGSYLPAGKALTFTIEREDDDYVAVRPGEPTP